MSWLRRLRGVEHELPSPWKLFTGAIADYRAHWRLMLGILAIIVVPTSILSTYLINPATDTSLAAYIAFAQLIMNTALVYAVVALSEGQKLTIRRAYYDGSAALVRLILVSVLFVLMLLPLVAGLFIIGAGVVAAQGTLALGEGILLILLAIGLALPSFILLARAFGAVFALFQDEKWPLAAVRFSRNLTKGKTAPVLGRLLAMGIFLAVVAVVPAAIFGGLAALTHWSFFTLLLQIVITFLLLPLSNFYMYRLYKELQ